ncbi:DUF1289 domain-containing protein [Pararhodospirillum photometricum]|uniref:Fe-S protein n=1 Tax=Pararhodospirillum photometricum DSM 122 TaxID=1150469 RepID=H6SII8_PARPM|nr:DUF1289 domain-containing protein [Pararhodospirillum photometricum]CCG06754.1 Putative uncharacterized protein [Pararhodospirillum photometricum DSM 122]
MTDVMPSPCVGICEMSPEGSHCLGCARTVDEIRDWSTSSSDAKRAVFQALVERRQTLGVGAPVLGHSWAFLDRVILGSLDDAKAAWAIGVPGACATFCPGDGTLVTARLWEYGGDAIGGHGGARVVLDHGAKKIKALGEVDPETGVVRRLDLCLSVQTGVMSQRRVLTEIGLDTEALRVGDRRGVLFDLGLGVAHIDICARVDNDDLLALLRQEAGKSILDPDSPVLAALDAAQAHRVALTRLGRIEAWGAPDPTLVAGGPCAGTRLIVDPAALRAAPGTGDPRSSLVPRSLFPLISLFPDPARRLGLA